MRLPTTTRRVCTVCGVRATEAWWRTGEGRCDLHHPRARRWDLPSLGVPPVIDGPQVFDGSIDEAPVGEWSSGAGASDMDARSVVIREMIDALHPRDVLIAAMRFADDASLVEIGEVFGISTERVRQILGRVRSRLVGRKRIRAAFASML